LNALRVFEATARHLSLKKAADELCVSHSAVSLQIKTLEEQLGTALFTRHARGVELTAKGLLYYPVLRRAFDEIGEVTQLIQERDQRSVVTLQVYATFAIRWFLPRLSRLNAREPTLQVCLHTDQRDADLEHNDIDVAIMIGNPPDKLISLPLFKAYLRPVCSPSYLARVGPITEPSHLMGKQLLHVYPSPDDWPNWFSQVGMSRTGLAGSLQLESYEVAINSAEQGLGIMIGQEPYIDQALASGSLVELLQDFRVENPNQWYLVARRERWKQPKVEALRDWLIEEIRTDPSLVPLA
jgi:LysR family glycine cleavage system transcriptional activator